MVWYCYNNGKKVSEAQAFSYRRKLENTFEERFRILSKHIRVFMQDEFGIALSYKFEPESKSGYKVRPFCYSIFSRDVGGGQITAQLNFRLSNDRRPGEVERTRKVGVKFSLHDKCSETLKNEDIHNFAENVMKPIMQERLLNYFKSLHDDFYIFRSLGRCNGVDRLIKANDIKRTTDLEHGFLVKEDNGIFFQEIFRAYQWNNLQSREILGNMNTLAMVVVKDFISLYPFYLFAVIRGQRLLLSELDKYDRLLKKNRPSLNSAELHLLGEPNHFILEKGHSESKFTEMFRKYVCDARLLWIEEPWMEYPKQRKNLMLLLNLVETPNNCKVTLITKNKLQNAFLEEMKKSIQNRGFRFEYRFEDIHNRLIRTDCWTISLPKGLHMFKRGKAEHNTEISYTPLKRYKLTG